MIWFGKSFIKFCKSFINLIKLVSTRTCSPARVRAHPNHTRWESQTQPAAALRDSDALSKDGPSQSRRTVSTRVTDPRSRSPVKAAAARTSDRSSDHSTHPRTHDIDCCIQTRHIPKIKIPQRPHDSESNSVTQIQAACMKNV